MNEFSGARPGLELPWATMRYPRSARISVNFWAGSLGELDGALLLDSPMRQKISRLISDGQSAVWLLLESGDEQADEAAARVLQEQLKKLERSLKLTSQETAGGADNYYTGGNDYPELRIAFSLVRLSRTDPAEEMFIKMLLDSEWDLKTTSEPIAFPIFGRGRVLYALVGGGINEENVREACAFLTGDCSCEVKELNPGIDLLMSVDWDGQIEGRVIGGVEVPTLAGLSEFDALPADDSGRVHSASEGLASAAAEDSSRAPSANEITEKKARSTLTRNILIAVALGLLILMTAAFILKRKGDKPGALT